MQLKKRKIAQQLGFAAIGVTFALSATADTFTATVTTIDDVSITEIQPLDFGTNVYTTVGKCTMDGDGPTLTEMVFNRDNDNSSGNFGNISGTSCVTAAAQGGIWEVTGSVGADINLLITTIPQASADYTFTPDNGCYVSYTGNDNTDSDTCAAISPGTVYNAKLAAAAGTEDDSAGVNAGVSVGAGGFMRFAMGGDIDIINPLTAETSYDLTFQVDVTY
jgi:hypothetical protein